MRVLICGGGVIGASIAYFLSCRGVQATVIERTGVACAASGKSGGFLALDWCDGSPLEALARRSFALHASLADRIGRDWGYRRLTTYGGSAAANRARGSGRGAHAIDWLSDGVRVDRRLGSADTTAQVHPGAFTAAMMQAAQANGAELRLGRVTGIVREAGSARVSGVEVDGSIIEGDAVVIAMGPWSVLAAQWLPLPAVFGLKGHSLVFETGTKVPAEALFLEYREARGAVHSPEIFPRTDGTTYVCAISSESPLPVDPGDVAPDPGVIDRLQAMCNRLSPTLGGGEGAGPPGLLSARHTGWLAADRSRAWRRGRLRCHRPQRVGHSQRAGNGGGGRGADRRRHCPHGRPVAIRSRATGPAGPRAPAGPAMMAHGLT